MTPCDALDTARNGAIRRPSASDSPPALLIEAFAPASDADVAECHEIEIDAPAGLVFDVAESFDLLSISTVYAIFWLRARILGAAAPARDDLDGLVRQTKAMGWGELARRPGRELVMGAAVQPWLPEPVFKPIPPERFREFHEPEHVKIVWTLEAEPLGPTGTRFTTRTRVRATDEQGGKRFRRYWRFAGMGIVLIRLLLLPAIRKEAERRWRASGGADGRSPGPLELDRLLPEYDATIVRRTTLDAPSHVTYSTIADTNLLDPLVRALFAVREAPGHFLSWLGGKPRPRGPRSLTMSDFLRPDTGMVLLAEEPGVEIVVGSVGRFWERDYGHRQVAPRDFASFDEPGYAKLAMDLWVRSMGDGRSVIRYEARTATTDEEARRRFGLYWKLIRPGVWLVMGRAMARIRKEAETRAREKSRPSSNPKTRPES